MIFFVSSQCRKTRHSPEYTRWDLCKSPKRLLRNILNIVNLLPDGITCEYKIFQAFAEFAQLPIP